VSGVSPLDPAVLVPAAVILLLAGVLKGSIGFGFPTVAVPALALVMQPRAAIALVSVPLLLTNLALLARRPSGGLVEVVRRLLPLLVTYVPATVVGGVLLARVSSQALTLVVGSVCVLVGGASLANLNLAVPRRLETRVSAGLGVVAGLLNGATGIPGPMLAVYLAGLGLVKWAFVYGLTVLLTVGNVAQVASYSQLGLYSGGILLASLLLVPPALVGQQVGFRIQDRLAPEAFRRVVLVAVTLAGLDLLGRGLGLV
jgi:uncharacterized membrane protein YfcA